jgi:hypothetical protein
MVAKGLDVAGTLTPERSLDDREGGNAPPGRVLRRPRRLPDSRAVVGALLVAGSVVGIYAAYSGAHDGPRESYVVAAHPIAPGDTLAAGDLARTRADLPPGLSRRAFTSVAPLVGATSLGPLEAGELVQAGQVVRKRGGPRTSELSVPIEATRVGSGVRAGDRINVIATYGTGNDAYSVVVGPDVQVLDVSRAQDALGGDSGSMMLTVALRGRGDALALAHATRAAELSVIRTTGLPAGTDEPSGYRPGSVPPAAP